MEQATRAATVAELLLGEYPDAASELDYRSPWELLVATVLSAQCTDVRVNKVTPELFDRWPRPEDLASATQEEVEDDDSINRDVPAEGLLVASCGGGLSSSDHDGEVPADLEALVALPGVGRKTAKVVLGEGFGIAAGVTVDTHVRRLARRLGLTRLEDPEKIAAELETFLPQEEWIKFSTRLILHGRRVCSARSPRCDECVLSKVCPKIGV